VAAAAGSALPSATVGALSSEDEDTRTQAVRLLLAASRATAAGGEGPGGAPLWTAAVQMRAAVAAAGGVAAARAAADRAAVGDEGSVDPEEAARLGKVVTWLESASA